MLGTPNEEWQGFYNASGFTPLMVAVRNGYINSSVTFLQAGANPESYNTLGLVIQLYILQPDSERPHL